MSTGTLIKRLTQICSTKSSIFNVKCNWFDTSYKSQTINKSSNLTGATKSIEKKTTLNVRKNVREKAKKDFELWLLLHGQHQKQLWQKRGEIRKLCNNVHKRGVCVNVWFHFC